MSDNQRTDTLHQLLADTYCLLMKTHNFHWNVTGPHFGSLHALFETQYNELFLAADEIAERIRALGAKVPASPAIFQERSSIVAGDANTAALSMVKQLADDQSILAQTGQAVLRAAQASDDEVTADLAIARITVHDKARWMLESFLE